MSLIFVCFKWQKTTQGFKLPGSCKYSFHHVNTLRNMLEKNISVKHKLICFTDDPVGIDKRVEIKPIWDKCKNLGGCFNRLYVFSDDMKNLIGNRFICIDLDCVIVNDSTDLFTGSEDFKINTYNAAPGDNVNQLYNGALFMMDAGARDIVWNSFDYEKSAYILSKNTDVRGSDQAWIRHTLGATEKRWGNLDGIYEARQIKDKLPKNARIIFFSGPRDPSLLAYKWIGKYWK